MVRKVINAITRRDLELRERVFRMVIVMGSLLAAISIIECLICEDFKTVSLTLIILLAAFLVSLVATFKYRKVDFAANILGVFMLLMFFPMMFLFNNGVNGGAPLWFVLGIIYVFLMFEKKRLYFFLALAIIADIGVYTYAYLYPDQITPLSSRFMIYLDSLFGVFAVSITSGLILKFQFKIFALEREVTQKQKEELEVINNSKNNFFASMSHEIRTPINTIIGLNEMILRESKEEGICEYAQDIQKASKMLLSLVNDILDLSQMEMKRMEIVPMEYQTEELLREIVTMLQVRLAEKKLDFLVDIDEKLPTKLLGDVKRIQQILINILTNAAKYTEEGSVTLRVEVENIRIGEVMLKIMVIDTGIGIRNEDFEHLYDLFHRVDIKRTQKIEGSGLGLAITKQLVDLMDGEITVDSIYTKGSTFTVMIPQKVVDGEPVGKIDFYNSRTYKHELYQQSFEAPEARILIVDDNEMNSLVTKKLLSATKMKIDIANSGAKCLKMTKRKYYHVILMDYMMPEMNGVETLRQLRKQENSLCRDSVVIVLTANTMTEASELSKENQFNGFLEKPLQGSVLEAEILKFLPEDIIEYRREIPLQETLKVQHVTGTKRRKIYITTDCVSDLPKELLEKYNIGLMYLYIKTDHGRFADIKEIDSGDWTEYLQNPQEMVRADGVSVEEYEAFYAGVLAEAEEVIHISLASEAGKSYGVAVAAAEGFDHVHVVDSGQISCGQGLIVLYAAKLAEEGLSTAEICAELDQMKKRVVSQFLLPGAEALYQGGYTNRYLTMLSRLFQFHPILKMKHSKLNVVGLRNGKMQNAQKHFIHRYLMRKRHINTDVIYITHAGLSVAQLEMIRREVLKCIPFERVIIQKASVSTSCTFGIGTLGFAYYLKEE